MCIWIDIIEGDMEEFGCCLSLGDSTSAVSWMHKSHFCNETRHPHKEAARHLTSSCIDNDMCVCAQHFIGTWNLVADCLSRDNRIPAHVLIAFYVYSSLLRCPQLFKHNHCHQRSNRGFTELCDYHRSFRKIRRNRWQVQHELGSLVRISW